MPLRTDARFWVLSEALSSYASDADDPPVRDADTVQARLHLLDAVAQILKNGLTLLGVSAPESM